MKPHLRTLLALAGVSLGQACGASPALWFPQPAVNWEKEALPIGNGRLGAMIFGGAGREHIQFNESSLWIGDESDTGAYQAFGDVFIELAGGGGIVSAACTSGQASPAGQDAGASVDGDASTKWCMEHRGRPAVWAGQLPSATSVPWYAFTSGGDMPDRDPRSWTLEGSNDGRTWAQLDRRTNEPPFAGRRQRREYAPAKAGSFRQYRFTFSDHGSRTHFQVAEIELGAPNTQPAPSNYRRELDIGRAVHTVTYERGGVNFRREYFASHPADVMVFRFSADQPGALTGSVSLTDMHAGKIVAGGNKLVVSGSLAGYAYQEGSALAESPHRPYQIALDYEAQVLVVHEGGTLAAADGRIGFEGVNRLTVFINAGTDFVQDRAKGWRGRHPRDRIAAQLEAAAARPFERLLAEHEADHRNLFDRVTLDLGGSGGLPAPGAGTGRSPPQDPPTDLRLLNYTRGAPDRGLEALVFQYGRYLLIGSSRDVLPANLQGVWNNSIRPPWRCDYHTDVNVQMNYWPADVANLSECFPPYATWLNSIREVRTKATRESFGTRGWTMRAENGIFGGSTWQWVESGSAWCLQNVWDHYAFTGDLAYLRTLAYPMMKEVCAFWLDRLKPLPDGTLVAPDGYSPEHGPREDGVSHDQQLVWDLFNNTVEAADALGVDRAFRDELALKRDRLLGPKIGRWGQLQEWRIDRDDPKDTHRHLSHLVAVYPGRQISPLATPQLAEAARVSLNARGDVSTGWSTAWKINLWARLRDGDRAHRIMGSLLRPVGDTRVNMENGGGLGVNLFDMHPPFQIDGNFGYTAGVCELLLQSHEKVSGAGIQVSGNGSGPATAGTRNPKSGTFVLDLLPALPKAWPEGRVTGLRARGGVFVDIAWKEGRLASASLRAVRDGGVAVRYAGKTVGRALKAGESTALAAADF